MYEVVTIVFKELYIKMRHFVENSERQDINQCKEYVRTIELSADGLTLFREIDGVVRTNSMKQRPS
jgi:hypothetical protein